MGKLIMLPTAKTRLYNNQIQLNKKTIDNVVMHVLNSMADMTKKQEKDLDKRIKIYGEIEKALSKKQTKLLLKYEELQAKETDKIIEQVISYVVKNENQVLDALAINY